MSSPAPPPGPPKLVNLYNVRQVGTPKRCFICSKDTNTCLGETTLSPPCPRSAVPAPELTLITPACSQRGRLGLPLLLRLSPVRQGCKHSRPSPLYPLAIADHPPSQFASAAPSAPCPTPAVPQAEIDKVTAAYKAKQAAKEKPSDSSESKGWVSTALSGVSTVGSAALSGATSATSALFPPAPVVQPVVAAPIPKQVVLQRNVFQMRVDEKRKKWQKEEAKKRLEGLSLPTAPRGLPLKR